MEENLRQPDSQNGFEDSNPTGNPIKRIFSFLFMPVEVFNSLKERHDWRDWVFPIVLLLIFSLTANSLVRDIAIRDSRKLFVQRLERNEQLSEEKKQEMIDRFDQQTQSANLVRDVLTTAVFLVLSLVIVAGIVHFCGNFLLGGEGNFSLMFAAAAYASLVDLVNLLVKIPLILVKNTVHIYTGLGLFLTRSDTFLFRFLSRFDLFALWKVVLIGLGMAVVYNLSPKKSIITVFVLWLIYGIAVSFLTGLFAIG